MAVENKNQIGKIALSSINTAGNTQPASPEIVKEKLAEIKENVHFPLNKEIVLSSIWEDAEQLNEEGLEKYDSILCDDTNGRLPGLLFGELINLRREELGLEPAEIRFMDGATKAKHPIRLFRKRPRLRHGHCLLLNSSTPAVIL